MIYDNMAEDLKYCFWVMYYFYPEIQEGFME